MEEFDRYKMGIDVECTCFFSTLQRERRGKRNKTFYSRMHLEVRFCRKRCYCSKHLQKVLTTYNLNFDCDWRCRIFIKPFDMKIKSYHRICYSEHSRAPGALILLEFLEFPVDFSKLCLSFFFKIAGVIIKSPNLMEILEENY